MNQLEIFGVETATHPQSLPGERFELLSRIRETTVLQQRGTVGAIRDVASVPVPPSVWVEECAYGLCRLCGASIFDRSFCSGECGWVLTGQTIAGGGR
jgi:hypothetical protein